MPVISDYHTHPLAHDPHRIYTDEIMNEWISSAKENNIEEIIFTDHDRFCKGIRFDVFEKARDKSIDTVTLRMGIELDNDPESSEAGRKWTEQNYEKLDYVLGSIHFINNWPFDHPDHIKEYDKWNTGDLYELYFKEIKRIADDGIYDCLAHLDLIKIFQFFPDRDVSSAIQEALDIIKKNNLVQALLRLYLQLEFFQLLQLQLAFSLSLP